VVLVKGGVEQVALCDVTVGRGLKRAYRMSRVHLFLRVFCCSTRFFVVLEGFCFTRWLVLHYEQVADVRTGSQKPDVFVVVVVVISSVALDLPTTVILMTKSPPF
jgi:hypothetical protein